MSTIETVSLKVAAELAHTNRNYLLKLIKNGKLPAEKVARGETEVMEYRIPADALNAWIETKGARTSARPDGRRKHVIFVTDEEAVALREQGFTVHKVIYKSRKAKAVEANVASPEHTADEPEVSPAKPKKGKRAPEEILDELGF